MNLSQRIVAAREHRGLTQDALAKLVGISQQAIQKLESEKSSSSRKLTEIAIACGVRPEWLASGLGAMVAPEVQVKDEHASYGTASQSQSQPLQLDPAKLFAATEYLEQQFRLRRREFVPSQHIDLLTQVYDFLVRTPRANTVALNRKFAQTLGGSNERQGTVGSAEPANRSGNRAGARKAAATSRRKG